MTEVWVNHRSCQQLQIKAMADSDRKTYRINNSTVSLIFGDILESKADALVISGSIGIPMQGGLPQYVRHKASDSVLIDARKHPTAKLGDVIVTSAGNLSNKYLFQAVTVAKYSKVLPHLSNEDNPKVYEYIIGHSISKSLRLLSAMELNSIAFPCLGLGMANMPMDAVAKITAKTICQFLCMTNKSISVEIYIHDSYDVYSKFDYLPFFEWLAAYSHEFGKKLEQVDYDKEHAISITSENSLDDELEKIEKKPHKVFFSYSRKDTEQADALCRLLDSMNIPYWIDRDGIFSGSNFKELIVKAISSTDIVLFLSSENSNRSINVAKEISIADQYNKIIIPVRLDSSAMHPKIAYDLAGIDFLDLFTFDDKSIRKLKNAILGQLAMSNSL